MIPVLLAHVEEGHARIHAGVVHEHVDSAELLRGRLDEGVGVGHARHVAVDDGGAAAGGAHLPRHRLRGGLVVEVVDADVGALAGEGEGHRPADALLGAGDKDAGVAKAPAHRVCSMIFRMRLNTSMRRRLASGSVSGSTSATVRPYAG